MKYQWTKKGQRKIAKNENIHLNEMESDECHNLTQLTRTDDRVG